MHIAACCLADHFIGFCGCSVAKSISAQSDGDKDLQEVKQRIQNLGDETAQRLKKQVYQNYQMFIDTAKEISCMLYIYCINAL